MDFGIGLSIVPIIIGVVVFSLRLGVPPVYETPLAVTIGVAISVGYTLGERVPGDLAVADATWRGVAVGLSSAGIIASIRRLIQGDGAVRR